MDLAGNMLLSELRSRHGHALEVGATIPSLPNVFRRTPFPQAMALNADRFIGRFGVYLARAALLRLRFDGFHVVDHSYAHLVHVLPKNRTGVYCHDLEVFRPLLEPDQAPRSAPIKAFLRTLLRGMQRAAIVFHSSIEVRKQIERHVLVETARLVHAPYGVSSEFRFEHDPSDGAEDVLRPLEGRPFLLHVGSSVPRKRLDVLFEVFSNVRAHRPDLWLVQLGGALTPDQRSLVERLGIGRAFLQPPTLRRATIAGLYRRARAVLFPSSAEGFGLPVIEALACGAPVLASDLPVLREVGGEAVLYCPVGDVEAWTQTLLLALSKDDMFPLRQARLAQASRFTWDRHADIIAQAYAERVFGEP